MCAAVITSTETPPRPAGHADYDDPLGGRRKAYAATAERRSAGRLKVEVQRFALKDVGATWTAPEASPHRKVAVAP
jgi:hypothetical protein